jgi:hypothetical protein
MTAERLTPISTKTGASAAELSAADAPVRSVGATADVASVTMYHLDRRFWNLVWAQFERWVRD